MGAFQEIDQRTPHFTYQRKPQQSDDLQQGDILTPQGATRNKLVDVDTYPMRSQYSQFLVLTQSCDLVRYESGKCKSEYIAVAGIRPLEEFTPELIGTTCESLIPGVFIEADRRKAEELLERIINQNEEKRCLFFLHADYDNTEIMVDSVAILRDTISIPRDEWYNNLQQCRTGRLAVPFQHRLGWLLGNVYSRVGVENIDKDIKKQKVKTLMNSSECKWVLRAAANALKKNTPDLSQYSPEEIETHCKNYQKNKKLEVLIEEITTELEAIYADIHVENKEDVITKLRARLTANARVSQALKG